MYQCLSLKTKPPVSEIIIRERLTQIKGRPELTYRTQIILGQIK